MSARFLGSVVVSLFPLSLLAQGFPDPNAGCPPAQCGKVSPLIPMQSAEAVHMGLVWKTGSQKPKILFHARFPEYSGTDMADPAITDLAISRGALTTALALPDYFGRNWDALWDCITDLGWRAEPRLVLVHEDVPALDDDDLTIYVRLLRDAVESWRNRGGRDLVVVFPPGAADSVKLRGG